jgi:hypothetical protein
MEDAVRSMNQAEEGARQQSKACKGSKINGKFPPGLEWDVLQADSIVLLGMSQLLSESYWGYTQCFLDLNKYVLLDSIITLRMPSEGGAAGNLAPVQSSPDCLVSYTPMG